jgi:uncharacterized protein YndB with AHSA1/START domain
MNVPSNEHDETMTLRVSLVLPHPAEQVFDAWLDPAKAGKFLFATPTGIMVKAEIDPRVGGGFTFTDRREGVEVVHVGIYIEIVRPKKLLFDFSVDGSETSRVSIEIAPLDSGCELTLTHTLSSKWKDYTDRMTSGWNTILDGLARNA